MATATHQKTENV